MYCKICGAKNINIGDKYFCPFCEYEEVNKLNFLDKAKSFTNSVYKFTKSGFHRVSQEQKQERLNICESCDKMNKDNKTCNECGCYLDIKTGWATESCPLGKWSALPILENTQKKPCGGCDKQNKKSE